MNHELPDVQAGFRKGRGTRYKIASIHWIIEKVREFQKNIPSDGQGWGHLSVVPADVLQKAGGPGWTMWVGVAWG